MSQIRAPRCPLRVIRDRLRWTYLPVDFRFTPKATNVARRCKTLRRAKGELMPPQPATDYHSVNQLTLISRRPIYYFSMESKFDTVITASAVGVAAYMAAAIGYVARYDLGFSTEEIRATAVAIAVVIAALIALDFFGKNHGKAKQP